MKIEIWSDFTCPYCYLGKRRLELALDNTGCRDAVEIEFRSFELDAHVKSTTDMTKLEILMAHLQLSQEEVMNMTHSLSLQAKEVGLELRLEGLQHTNTFQAHRLAKFLVKRYQMKHAIEIMFNTYFIEQRNIGEKEVLIDIARRLGVEETETEEFLCLNKFSKKVKEDIELAEELGINSVPFYIFDETYAVQGVQTIETFEEILKTLCNNQDKIEKPKPQTTYCEGKRCRRV